jgi:hypothetical protein
MTSLSNLFTSFQPCFATPSRMLSGSFVSLIRNQFWIPCITLYNDAAEVGCSGCDDEVPPELGDALVAPRCTGLAEVHVRYITLYNDAAEVGCSGCDDEVPPELGDALVAPRCTGLAEVHVR